VSAVPVPARRPSIAPAARVADPAAVPARKARRNGHSCALPTQRDRLIVATGQLAVELGSPATGVRVICQRAGISRRTFYDLYADRDACVVDAHQEAFGSLLAHIAEAVAAAGEQWEDRAVAVVQALLSAWEADRVLAHLCLVSALGSSRETLGLHRAAITEIAALLPGAPPQPLDESVLTGAIGSVWELALSSLTNAPDSSMADLTGAAIYLMLAPFVGRRHAAARAAGHGGTAAYVTRLTSMAVNDIGGPGLLITELTGQTLHYLNGHPGSANIDIARAIDVRHESQMSRHLVRLEKAGLIERRRDGRHNAWRLTARGEDAARSLRDVQPAALRPTPATWSSTARKEA
jgi:AcrR family transcriptional regulator/DNA-binding HxlR family transcriptional regulator